MKQLLPLLLTIVTLLFLPSATASAQINDELRHIYSQAENDIAIGRLEEARQALLDHLNDFHGDLLQGVYRMLVFCALGLDEDEEAEKYVNRLLNENPYYSTTASDPQRFIDMINRNKSGRYATITTASSQAENLNESPVPVTLITEDMIRISGARNLKEVLLAYVPGMTSVDCNNDINIAMRGIYSEGQEKMLLLLNGHRLNSYATNVAAPDFSISLEKIKQIEVLRGPASSLYGGVALTAVINIITKQGIDIDGVKMRASAGNYGQLRGDLLFGKRFFDLDIVVWGSLYRAKGQAYNVPLNETGLKKSSGDVWIGRIGTKPSYDLGITLNWRGLYFLYNTHFSQVHSPYTSSHTFSPYDADRYISFRGLSPSFATQNHHTELSYHLNLPVNTLNGKQSQLNLSATINYDLSDMTHYQVVTDSAVLNLGTIMGLPLSFNDILSNQAGVFRYQDGQENSLGLQVKGDYNYLDNDVHKGHLGFGANISRFKLEDSRYVVGINYKVPAIEYTSFYLWAQEMGLGHLYDLDDVAKGHETDADAYVQIKHRWGNFIFNGGLRYDYRKRFDDDEMNELSPRLALIYVQPKWHITFSYSKSFVDAPYFYRKTNLLLFEMSVLESIAAAEADHTVIPPEYTLLEPERLFSWQLNVGTTGLLPGLDAEINTFYSRADKLIYPQRLLHDNLGEGRSWGIELMASYHRGPFDAYLATTWQKVFKAEYFGYSVEKIPGIPSFNANAVLAWRLFKDLRLHTHLDFAGKFDSYMVDPLSSQYNIISFPSRFLVDVGAEYQLGKFELSFNVHNLLNHHYKQSGLGSGPIQQQGLWFMGGIGYKF